LILRALVSAGNGVRNRLLLLLSCAIGVVALESLYEIVDIVIHHEQRSGFELMSHVYERTLVLAACCVLGVFLTFRMSSGVSVP
jgi:hypothetical protein